MIKHILTIIWNQRRANGWIFAELLIVVAVLYVMMDSILVDRYTYHSSLGFSIENTYKVNIGVITSDAPDYVDESMLTTRQGEDMLRLVENLRQHPRVEEVALAVVGNPYSYNSSWSGLIRTDADSSAKVESFQEIDITPEYFDVLHITDLSGNPIRPLLAKNSGDIVVTSDLADRVFGDEPAVGKYLTYDLANTDFMTVAAVCSPIRQTEYKKSNPRFYRLLSSNEMIRAIEQQQPQAMDCLLRMKSDFSPEEIEAFLLGIDDRLTVNNVYVSSITPMKEIRKHLLKEREDNMKKKTALVGFMLINVFFGIIGTFWLRTQARQGEMGLRIALGSNRNQLSRLMNLEGLILLVLTIPFVLIFILNMLYFELPDTVRLPYTWWRFVATFGGAYLLMAGMICLGIWFPIRKTNKMEPAEALHYE